MTYFIFIIFLIHDLDQGRFLCYICRVFSPLLKEVIGLTSEALDSAIDRALKYGFRSTKVTDEERKQIRTASTLAGDRGIRAGKAIVAPLKE